MTNINLRDLPATKEYMKDFSKQVFDPILNGEGNALITIPKFGANSFIKYTLRFADEFDNKLKKRINELTWLRLELAGLTDEEELWEYLLAQLKRKFPDKLQKGNENAKAETLRIIQEHVNQNENLIFIINSAEELIENKKEFAAPFYSIATLAGFIKFILIIYKEEPQEELQELLLKLRINNKTYLKMRNKEDMLILLDKEERWYNYTLPKGTKDRIAKLSGGFASLCRGILSLANNDTTKFSKLSDEEIANSPQVSLWLLSTYNSLEHDSQRMLQKLLIKNDLKLENFSQHCRELKIVQKDKGSLSFFTPLMRYFLHEYTRQELHIKSKGAKILIYDIPLKDILSKQEYLVFEKLWKNKGRVVSRENLAKIMWGKNWKEKYSDWAIDRVMHKVRNKLGDNEKTLIKTQKGKGFKLNSK